MATTQTVDVLDAEGKKAGTAELPAEVFDVATNVPLIHQVVVAQLAAACQGTGSAGDPDIIVEVEVGFGQVVIEERS